MDTLPTLHYKIDRLHPSMRREAALFLDFLIEKKRKNNRKKERKFGSAKGKIHISEDFDQPLTEFKDYM